MIQIKITAEDVLLAQKECTEPDRHCPIARAVAGHSGRRVQVTRNGIFIDDHLHYVHTLKSSEYMRAFDQNPELAQPDTLTVLLPSDNDRVRYRTKGRRA